MWQVLQPGLRAVGEVVDYRISNHVHDLQSITRELVHHQPDFLVVIGGDGTLNHVLNGFIDNDQLISPTTQLAYFNTGSGGDFARQFPTQHVTEFLDRLVHRQTTSCNVGKISLVDQTRYFLNIASCGLSGHVVSTMNLSKWTKKLGGTINYFLHSVWGLLKYEQLPVRIQVDDNPAFDCSLLMLAVCNGRYFGGRMNVAPMARIDDDVLDVVILHDFTRFDALMKFRKIYTGSHLLEPNVHYLQAKKVHISPRDGSKIQLEADGEYVGSVPAEFELLAEKIAIVL